MPTTPDGLRPVRYRMSSRDLWLSRAGIVTAAVVGLLVLVIFLVTPAREASVSDNVVAALILVPIAAGGGVYGLRFMVLRIDRQAISIGTINQSLSSGLTWHRFDIDDVVRFEVRRWVTTKSPRWRWMEEGPRFCLSVLLGDGTWLCVRGFVRAPGLGGPTRIILSRHPWRRPYLPVRDLDGRRLRWTEDNDWQIEAFFNAQLDAARDNRGPRGRPVHLPGATTGIPFDIHRRRPPVVASQRLALSEAINGRLDPPIVPPPEPPRPRAIPSSPSSARLWDDRVETHGPRLELPTCYWTLASLRAGSLAGRPPSMTIDSVGVQMTRRLRRDVRVTLQDVDRFDIEFDGIDPRDPYDEDERTIHGNWRLLLYRTDGTTVPLSGLDHGYFQQNQLFWSTSGRTGRKLPAPDGSMPWPNDQPVEVAARLNAHLEVARRAGSRGAAR